MRRPGRDRRFTSIGAASASPPIVWTPASISSVGKYFWLEFETANIIEAGGAGTGISQVTDLYGLNNATQATLASRPAFTASDGNFDNHGSATFDGTDDALVLTGLDLPAPGTTPFFLYLVFRQLSWTSNDCVVGAQFNTLAVQQSGASPALRQLNASGANSNSGAPIGTSVHGYTLFTNSVADYLRLGATTVTGASAGGTDPTAGNFTLGARSAGTTGFANMSLAAALATAGEPTELAQLKTYFQTKYPSAVS